MMKRGLLPAIGLLVATALAPGAWAQAPGTPAIPGAGTPATGPTPCGAVGSGSSAAANLPGTSETAPDRQPAPGVSGSSPSSTRSRPGHEAGEPPGVAEAPAAPGSSARQPQSSSEARTMGTGATGGVVTGGVKTRSPKVC
jgi:hypothetical protein